MATDWGPLDEKAQQRILDIAAKFQIPISQVMDAYRTAQGAGAGTLQQYYNAAGTAIGEQFQPQFTQARNFLGAQPLLADSGYANRLNRQLLGDIYARMSTGYGQAAAEQSSRMDQLLSQLLAQRQGYNANLLGQGYGMVINPPKKKKFDWGGMIGTGLGAVGGAVFGGPAGAAAGANIGGGMGSYASDAYYG